MSSTTHILAEVFGSGHDILVMDMETTGLMKDPNTIPLELGAIVVNPVTLEVRAQEAHLIRSERALAWAHHTRVIADRGGKLDVAQKMHVENGLVDDLIRGHAEDGSLIPMDSVEASDHAFRLWIEEVGMEDRPLVGASIGSLDRPMILKWFPEVNGILSHRNVDTSSLLEAIGLFDADWSSELAKRSKALSVQHGLNERHRTVADCLDVLIRLRFLFVESGLAEITKIMRARFNAEREC